MPTMNSHDIAYALRRFQPETTPNRHAVALVLQNLQRWADDNSDGWAYWSAPSRAARVAMLQVASTTNAENWQREANDITPKAARAAVAPIKGFLTRVGARDSDAARIVRPITLTEGA